MGKTKVNKEVKIQAQNYDNGEESFESIALMIGVSSITVRKWYYTYKQHGESAFEKSNKNKSYSKEFKVQVAKQYNNGHESLLGLSAKYNISISMVERWVNKYNNGIEINDYNPRIEVYTMKKRKTTFEERVKIVQWVIKNDMNYKEASIKYLVPYASIYLWTKKYLKDGEDSLKHSKRGRKTKNSVDLNKLSEVERLKYELELERKKRERLEFEFEVHKKKEEFARKLQSQK